MNCTEKSKSHRFLRMAALFALAAIMALSLASCKARRLHPTSEAKETVGTVTVNRADGSAVTYEVPYEEFYFLAKNYYPSVAAEYKEGTEEFDNALMKLISENITANYATLALCDEVGLVYDEKELRKEVKDYVEGVIDEYFGGKRSTYLDSIEEEGMTDHYLRFVSGVELLYAKLPDIYTQKDLVPNTEAEIREYINENYICTKHILIFDDSIDTPAENVAKAEKARELLLGGTSINQLIGGSPINVNEDLLIPYDGYYFGKGTMDEVYEKAAFALEVGGVSEVVKTKAENNRGEYLDCYYVIQRMPLDKTYINKHLAQLGDDVAESIIANKYEALKATLTFVPNDYAKSLDVSELDAPSRGVDVAVIVIVASSVAGAAAIAAVTVILIRVRNKKIAAARAIRGK